MAKPVPVKVIWVDITSWTGWRPMGDVDGLTMIHNESYGLLYEKTDKLVTLLQTVMRNDGVGGVGEVLKIPRGCVKKIVRLKE